AACAPASPRPWCAPAYERADGANPAIACELLPMPLSSPNLQTLPKPNYAAPPAFAPALPAFFFRRSPVMRTPFCLYGSGGRNERISAATRSEEHTSELQSRVDLVCRLLLEKKKAKRPAANGTAVV